MQQGKGLQLLNIIHKALMTGQILFAAVCIYLIYSKSVLHLAHDLDNVLQVAALALTAGGIFAGIIFLKRN